jgi:hypothetical protein
MATPSVASQGAGEKVNLTATRVVCDMPTSGRD